jgi:hypothetical protein
VEETTPFYNAESQLDLLSIFSGIQRHSYLPCPVVVADRPGNPDAAVTARMLNCHHATLYRLLNNIVAIIDEEFDDEKRR